jgi:hypothetical protein
MMRRALVIGAQTGGLTGVVNDARAVASWLQGCEFAVDLRVGSAATRDAILEGFDALVARAGPEDAVVVYYSGHGGLIELIDRASARVGFLVPTDHEPEGPFRGIVETQWSARVATLTARTPNVTVIHDCCHAAQTVRAARLSGGRVRALAAIHITAAQLAAWRGERPEVKHPLGNPRAVRITAAAGLGLAWEHADASGSVHGAFTRALLGEASAPSDRATSWGALARRVRDRVLRATGRQRPEFEGPIDRRLFALDTADAPARFAVRQEGRRFIVAAGWVHGVERGDVFRSPTAADRMVVTQVGLFESAVELAAQPGRPGARDVVAVRRATQVPIAIDVGDPELHAVIATTIAGSARLCVGDVDPLARVKLRDGRIVVLHEDGQVGPSLDADRAARVVIRLARMAAARTLQRTVDELLDPQQLALAVERVSGSPGWLADGAELAPGDRVCLHVANRTQRTLWLHCFVIGPGLALEALGPISAGTVVESRATVVLGAVPGVGSIGFVLPEQIHASATGASAVELIALATTSPIDLSTVLVGDLPVAPAPSAEASGEPDGRAPEASRDLGAPPRAHHAVAARQRLRLR